MKTTSRCVSKNDSNACRRWINCRGARKSEHPSWHNSVEGKGQTYSAQERDGLCWIRCKREIASKGSYQLLQTPSLASEMLVQLLVLLRGWIQYLDALDAQPYSFLQRELLLLVRDLLWRGVVLVRHGAHFDVHDAGIRSPLRQVFQNDVLYRQGHIAK